MIVFRLSDDSDFFGNDGVNLPHKDYINRLSGVRNTTDQINMNKSYENVEIISSSPANYFRVDIGNRTLYYITKSFIVSKSSYIHNCTIDYWGSFTCSDNTFLNRKYEMVRQSNFNNIRGYDFNDPLLEKFSTTAKQIGIKEFYDEGDKLPIAHESKLINNINPIYYAVFAFGDDSTIGTSNIARGNTTTNRVEPGNTKGDAYVLVPILSTVARDFNSTVQDQWTMVFNFWGVTSQGTITNQKKYLKCYNSDFWVRWLINRPNYINKFQGIYVGPPIYSMEKYTYILSHGVFNIPLNQFNPTGITLGEVAFYPFICYVLPMNTTFNLGNIPLATPSFMTSINSTSTTPHKYLLQTYNFEVNNTPIHPKLLNNLLTQTNGTNTIQNAICYFTNRFRISVPKDTADLGDYEYSIDMPYQIGSTTSSYSQFLAGNTNSLDTAFKSNATMGAFNSLTSLTGGLFETGKQVAGGHSVLAGLSGITGLFGLGGAMASGILGSLSKQSLIKDNYQGRSIKVAGAIDEGLNLLRYLPKNMQERATFITKWNSYRPEEVQEMNKIIRDFGFYAPCFRSIAETYNDANYEVAFYQMAETEQMRQMNISDPFFNNPSYRDGLKDLMKGFRVGKFKPS